MPVTATTLLTAFLTGAPVSYTGKFAALNLGILLNSIDATAYCYHIATTQDRELLDITLLNATHHQYTPGKETTRIELGMFQGNTTLDTLIRDNFRTGTPITFEAAVPSPATTTFRATTIIQKYLPAEEPDEPAVTELQLLATTAPTWINF